MIAHVESLIERLKGLEFTPEEAERIIIEIRIRIRYHLYQESGQ